MEAPKVLLVDDEHRVLTSLSRELMEQDICEVVTAHNSEEAFTAIRNNPDLCVVCSDYRMPGMDGISFLAEIQKTYPNIIRIMLTGAADLNTAVDAVNRGNIFRFLIKPSPPDVFLDAIKAGIRQHQLLTAEHDLLNKTLSGSIKIMTDLLSALSPEIFNQANRLRTLARQLAFALRHEQLWEVDLASMLSQIGAVTVPKEVLEKWWERKDLSENEKKMVASIPHVGYQLVKNIPRLENVALAIQYQDTGCQKTTGSLAEDTIPYTARILKIVLDYDRAWMILRDPRSAYQVLLSQFRYYDPAILKVFGQMVLGIDDENLAVTYQPKPINQMKIYIEDVEPGMALAEDVLDRNGRLIIPKGTIITEVLKFRLTNFMRNHALIAPVLVEKME